MGQSSSVEVQSSAPGSTNSTLSSTRSILLNEYGFLHEQIRKHSSTLRQLTLVTAEDLQSKIKELNNLSNKFVDCNGKQLRFEVKEPGVGSCEGAGAGSSSTQITTTTTSIPLIWKGLIRVKCMKTDPSTGIVEKSRDLNLKQFLQIYNTFMTQMQGIIELEEEEEEMGEDAAASVDCEGWDTTMGEEAASAAVATGSSPIKIKVRRRTNTPRKFNMSSSILLEEDGQGGGGGKEEEEEEECCICLESRPQVSLPCAHSYCLSCIEQWNVDHKTCPICREGLASTNDTWVLEDKPNRNEMNMEMSKSLFGLTN